MLGRGPDAGAAGGPEHHGNPGLAAEHVFHFGRLVVKLIQGHSDEVNEHQLHHRPQTAHGRAHGRADNGAFGDGCVPHPFLPEFLLQSGSHAEYAAVRADVLAGHVYIRISLHFNLMGVVQSLGKIHGRHQILPSSKNVSWKDWLVSVRQKSAFRYGHRLNRINVLMYFTEFRHGTFLGELHRFGQSLFHPGLDLINLGLGQDVHFQ